MFRWLLTLLVVAAIAFGVYRLTHAPEAIVQDSADEAVATVVGFGSVMQNVPLSADPEIARMAIAESYSPYVTAQLLAEWEGEPSTAPGRQTSSPWPARIEPDKVAKNPDGSYTVAGNVIEITSEELVSGGAAGSYYVEAVVVEDSGDWRIASFRSTR